MVGRASKSLYLLEIQAAGGWNDDNVTDSGRVSSIRRTATAAAEVGRRQASRRRQEVAGVDDGKKSRRRRRIGSGNLVIGRSG